MKQIFKNVFYKIDSCHFSNCLSLGLADINYAVTVNDINSIQNVYSVVSANNANKFNFIFNVAGSSLLPFDNLDTIGRAFFSSNYFYQNGSRPLLLFEEEEKLFQSSILKWCVSQGLETPKIINCFNQKKIFKISSEQDVESYYNLFFGDGSVLTLFDKIIFIEDIDSQSFKRIIHKLEAAQELLNIRNPNLHRLLIYCSKLEADNEYNQFLHTYYMNEHANSQAFLKMLHTSSETKNILNFYHEQYETLPLWYKRVGHIIKILMGKRTIKSYLK